MQKVREAAESAVRKYMISVERKDILPFGSRSLRLQFLNAISLPVFTRTPIQGGGGAAIEVALVDEPTGQVVSSGPGSSAKVKIVVLGGDFGGDEVENWTLEEFNKNIVREREGKKPLLTGRDVILTLKDGKGLATDISFTDNSCWIRSRKFRLGARLVDDMDGARIREAISKPFIVKNYPRNSCMKLYPPSFSDEVWRLENIRKAGPFHKRLSEKRVNTVQDFLLLLSLDATTLRNIIGTTMSTKEWRVTVQHAQTCILDKTLYSYSESTSLQTNSVVFNVVGEVMGMFKDGQFVTIDKLSKAEKASSSKYVIRYLKLYKISCSIS
ncbi:hypothetical protein CDL12_04096 [Handroanthus impetiginosus]|uniref:Uncharacterized protein n=1 Tax=Handroanthus impetiginosus TaxID=429701 RepID=A0A2G9I0B3_9LAMI|nr:hypothetical protein CDL12_04096 [Handroanthus impetiginosus]